jgi:SAM-dependent methyltransferase
VFTLADFTSADARTFFSPRSRLERLVERAVPTFFRAGQSRANYAQFCRLLLQRSAAPSVLIVGGSVLGAGTDELLRWCPPIQLLETDVSFGPRTRMICDAHDLPLASDSFDGVVVQAVLEHVVDPYRCVEEIFRTLRPGGLVYVEMPFLQPVHARHDYTRFTHLGLRRLFARFDEIESGSGNGPGTALALAYQYFLLSFATRRRTRGAIRVLSQVSAFWLKYVDVYLARRPGSLDAASGYFFLGAKGSGRLADRDLVAMYRGGLA